ncbi:hypothetical protein L4C42_14245 [Vibrio wakamikoensis]|uniref:hypothetical protein n=1 Tax=Vibrio wakamikoensis TaxID=2910251 RepID=UPI003D19E7B2
MYKLKNGMDFSITYSFNSVENSEHFTKLNRKVARNPDFYDEMLTVAKTNAGLAIYAATIIGNNIGSFISDYFLASSEQREEGDVRNVLFHECFVSSSVLSFNTRRDILFKILNSNNYCSRKKKDSLHRNLKLLQEWRNAFAHGHFSLVIEHEHIQVAFNSNGDQEMILDDSKWKEIDLIIDDIRSTLNAISLKLMKERNCHTVLEGQK